MALQFPPLLGQILECDYSRGFVPPEMVKKRLVVVISPRLPHRDFLCNVVPLSTTPPRADILYQCKIKLPIAPPPPFRSLSVFAKADMFAAVSYQRLSMPSEKRDTATGKRKYVKIVLSTDELKKVHCAILYALGLSRLTDFLE